MQSSFCVWTCIGDTLLWELWAWRSSEDLQFYNECSTVNPYLKGTVLQEGEEFYYCFYKWGILTLSEYLLDQKIPLCHKMLYFSRHMYSQPIIKHVLFADITDITE